MRLAIIWEVIYDWKRQTQRWWLNNIYNSEEVGADMRCWESDWVLSEAVQLPGRNNVLKKKKNGGCYMWGGEETPTTTQKMERSGGAGLASEFRRGNRWITKIDVDD